MTTRDPKPPKLSAGARKSRAARQDRLAAELRDNLRKRKAQARGRAAGDARDPCGAEQDPPGGGEA